MVDKKTGLKPKAKSPESKTAKTGQKKPVVKKTVTKEPVPVELVEKPIAGTAAEAKAIAKAGKRSARAIKEAEEKQAKEARRVSAAVTKEVPTRPPHKPPRSRLERAGKKFREVAKLIDRSKKYSLAEAMELVTKTTTTKFDSTIELHINLGVDPKQADQNIRGTVGLPSGTGKTLRVAVFAEGADADQAKAAGADLVGVEEISKKLDAEEMDFDSLIAPPTLMPQLAKYARLLGPRGLMPSPKSGTVATDVVGAVKAAKAGRVEYRIDSAGIVHLGIGKVSFGPAKLQANAEAVLASIRAARPASLKGDYFISVFVTTTMGPSIKIGL